MSVEAITWALKLPIRKSSAKFVLVVLANCASGETFLAYPSVAYLCAATGQDRKTVMFNLSDLCDFQLIEDTGKRVGSTRRVPVYRLLVGNSPENGISPEIGTVQTVPFSPLNSPVFPDKQSRKRDTETSGNNSNLKAGSATRGTRLPKDWKPSPEAIAYATERNVDWKAQAEAFADHWAAAAGSKGVKLDWDATWRTWVRRSPTIAPALIQRPARKPPGPSETPLERAIAHARHQFSIGGIDATERDRLIAEATQKHRKEPA